MTEVGPQPRPTRTVAVALFVACIAMTAYSLVSLLVPGSEQIPDRPSLVDFLTFTAIFLAYPSVGLAVAWKVPSNPIGWLYLVVGVAITISVFATEYAGRVAFGGQENPGAVVVAWLGGSSWLVAAGIGLPVAIALFPDGRLPARRLRPFFVTSVAAVGLTIAGTLVQPRPIEGYEGYFQNPVRVPAPLDRVAALAADLGIVTIIATGLFAVAAVVLRFRSSRGVERQQLKWLLYPAGLFVVAISVASISDAPVAWSVSLLGLAAVPVGAGIAILRYRLYEIDVVIRRTLVYGVVVVILGALYVALVLLLQSALSQVTGGGPLPVALSTLVIAALFGPVRARVRDVVDRRFYRARYSAQRTLETFAVQLRDEVELEAVARRLADVVDSTVRPASTTVWLRAGGTR